MITKINHSHHSHQFIVAYLEKQNLFYSVFLVTIRKQIYLFGQFEFI